MSAECWSLDDSLHLEVLVCLGGFRLLPKMQVSSKSNCFPTTDSANNTLEMMLSRSRKRRRQRAMCNKVPGSTMVCNKINRNFDLVLTSISVKRNEVGVQLLSRKLHAQLFKNVSCPAPDPSFIRIAREHLEMHGIDRTKGSVLPDTSFV